MFITLEGPEGSGKTSQIPALAGYLREAGYEVVVTREPGGTTVGDQIRDVLMNMENVAIVPRTEILLFLAARAQHVERELSGDLQRGLVDDFEVDGVQIRLSTCRHSLFRDQPMIPNSRSHYTAVVPA